MSKLIERLDEMKAEYPEVFKFNAHHYYPKLRAVAVAAKKLRTPIDENYSVNDRMQAIVEVDRALAALEEDV